MHTFRRFSEAAVFVTVALTNMEETNAIKLVSQLATAPASYSGTLNLKFYPVNAGTTTPTPKPAPKPAPGPMPDSKILSDPQAKAVAHLFDERPKFKKLYTASKDGWTIKDWGNKVWKQGKTLTIVKTTGGQILGGYTTIPWEDISYWSPKKDKYKTFLFYIKDGKAIKLAHKGRGRYEVG